MDIYGVREIDGTPWGTYYVSGRREAYKIARKNLLDMKTATITRYRITRRLSKALLLNVINDEPGWCQQREEIGFYKPEPADEACARRIQDPTDRERLLPLPRKETRHATDMD